MLSFVEKKLRINLERGNPDNDLNVPDGNLSQSLIVLLLVPAHVRRTHQIHLGRGGLLLDICDLLLKRSLERDHLLDTEWKVELDASWNR